MQISFSTWNVHGIVLPLIAHESNEEAFEITEMVITAVFLGVIVAGLSILDIYLLKRCFEQQREEEDAEAPAFPLTVPHYVFAR